MSNIKFNYFYRCSGNYKKFISIIFANSDEIELLKLESLIKSKLIEDTWFYADAWQLPEIFTDIVDFRIDPTWHEFEIVEYTDETPNTTLDLIDMIKAIRQT